MASISMGSKRGHSVEIGGDLGQLWGEKQDCRAMDARFGFHTREDETEQ